MLPHMLKEFIQITRESEPDTRGVRLSAILRDNAPGGYCVDCLALRLDLPVKEVRDRAQVLVLQPAFRVFERACYACGFDKDSVVMFVGRGLPVQ
jgi:hypothetical protein